MKPVLVFKIKAFPTLSETFIVSNMVEAIKKGYEVHIIADTIHATDNTSQPEILREYNLLSKVVKFDQPKGKIIRYLRAIISFMNPLKLYFFIKYFKLKKKKKLDYIFVINFYWKYRKTTAFHVHFATAIHPLFELKEIGLLKSKIVVTFHGYDEHGLHPGSEKLKNTVLNFNQLVTHTTANTAYLKEKLVAKGFNSNKIKVVPIGIDTQFFQNKEVQVIEKQVIKLITVGRFIKLKGQEYGIQVVKLLKDKGYKVEYTLVGYGNEFKNLQELAKDLKVEEMIHFVGSKNQDEIKTLLSEHHLFLMTSTCDTTNRCETFGVVSLEAQAMGLPVIGFKAGGFPETLIEGKTGITVEDKDIEAMALAIEKLIQDPTLLNEMRVNARTHVRANFDVKHTNQKYIDLYEK